MTRAAALAFLLMGTEAPIQCTRDPDPSERIEDTAGDALWNLAGDFEARGDHAAAVHTLEVLAARYPSSRHTPAAKIILDGGAFGSPDAAHPFGYHEARHP